MRSSDDPEVRHLYRLGLSRLYRIMGGLMKKYCPSSGEARGGCYWCGAELYLPMEDGSRVYIGDLRGQHNGGCPWNEVIDFMGYQTYLEGLDGASAEEADPDTG